MWIDGVMRSTCGWLAVGGFAEVLREQLLELPSGDEGADTAAPARTGVTGLRLHLDRPEDVLGLLTRIGVATRPNFDGDCVSALDGTAAARPARQFPADDHRLEDFFERSYGIDVLGQRHDSTSYTR